MLTKKEHEHVGCIIMQGIMQLSLILRVFVLCAGRFGRGAFIVFEVCADLVVQKNDEIPPKSFI